MQKTTFSVPKNTYTCNNIYKHFFKFYHFFMKTTPKLISYTIVDFPSETHMELGTRFFEEKASEFFNKAEKKGLLRWRMNRVWNKQGGFTLSQVYEYKDEKAFKNCQIIVNEFYDKYKNRFFTN